jgi:YVTN family beta-propeller protein
MRTGNGPIVVWRTLALVPLLSATLVAVPAAGSTSGPAAAEAEGSTRHVVFVANAEDGTVDAVDAHRFEIIASYDVLPDGEAADPTEDDPFHGLLGQRFVEAVGGDNYAQDQDVSPDGRTLYVSRGHRGDVAAFDLATGAMDWKVPISGFRADHMTISDDGRYLYVSAMTDNVVEVIDTATAEVVGDFATGEWPHDNHLSPDGARIYNASIGALVAPEEVREDRPVTVHPVAPEPYVLTVAETGSLEVIRSYEFDAGVRPFVLTDDERLMYAQLSEFHGLIEFDLQEGQITRVLDLPVDEGVTEDDYDFEAPHHGLAMSPDEEVLCAAGRASDYVALVSTRTMEPLAIIDVGDGPSWSTNSPDGRYCFVANTYDHTVSVVSYAQREEVTRIDVTGEGPKHLVAAAVPTDVFEEAPALAGGGHDAGEGRASSAREPGTDAAALPTTGGAHPAVLGGLGALALASRLVLRRRSDHAVPRSGYEERRSR